MNFRGVVASDRRWGTGVDGTGAPEIPVTG